MLTEDQLLAVFRSEQCDSPSLLDLIGDSHVNSTVDDPDVQVPTLTAPQREPPLHVLESSLEAQLWWYETYGKQLQRQSEEDKFGSEAVESREFECNLSSVTPSASNTVSNYEIVCRGESEVSHLLSKSFPGMVVSWMTVEMPRFRVVRNARGFKHAEYLLIVTLGGLEAVKYGIWKRHSHFAQLVRTFTALEKQLRLQHMFLWTKYTWQRVQRQNRWYKCLDAAYLARKCSWLERFMEAALDESPTATILAAFLGLPQSRNTEGPPASSTLLGLHPETTEEGLRRDHSTAASASVHNAKFSINELFVTSSDVVDKFVQIRHSDVPKFLQVSSFYLALDPQDTEEITIPGACYAADDLVTSALDLLRLLEVVVFWGLDAIPTSVLMFCENNNMQVWEGITRRQRDNGALYSVLTTYFRNRWSISAAMASGRSEIVQHWLSMNPPSSTYGKSATAQVAEMGDLDLLTEMYIVRGYSWNSKTSYAAAKRGHMSCLQFMLQNGCEMHPTCCEVAAAHGHFDCFMFLHSAGCLWDESKMRAAAVASKRSNIEFLQYAHQHGCPFPQNITCSADAACLQYALQNGVPVSEDTFLVAMSTEDVPFECLLLLREYGAQWDERTCEAAIMRPLVYLQYVMKNNCPHNDTILVCAARNSRVKHLKYLIDDCLLTFDENVLSGALVSGSVKCVQYLVDLGCSCDVPRLHVSGPLHDALVLLCIQYIVEHGWTCNPNLVEFVINNNLPACQEYLNNI